MQPLETIYPELMMYGNTDLPLLPPVYHCSTIDHTAVSNCCCTAQDSLNVDHLCKQFEGIWKHMLKAESNYRKTKPFED